MLRYNPVSPAFWSDPVVRGYSDDARLLALYLLTCPHRTAEGLFRLPTAYMISDLQWVPERFAEPFAELLASGLIEYDEQASVCLITVALQWGAAPNRNQAIAAARLIEQLPETPLLQRFLTLAETHVERLAEVLRERFPEGFAEDRQALSLPLPLSLPPENSSVAASGDRAGSDIPDDVQVDDRDPVDEVWAAYVETRRRVLGARSAPRLTPARRQLIVRRLQDWPLPDLLDAVRGWQHSPHNRGENDRGQPFCDLELLLRDAAHIERFRDLQRQPPPAALPPAAGGAGARASRDEERRRRGQEDLAALKRLQARGEAQGVA